MKPVFESTKTVVLVDFSWILYAFGYSLIDMKSSKGEHTGAIFGVVRFIYRTLIQHPSYEVWFCKDGIPVNRIKEQGGYKGNRVHEGTYNVHNFDKFVMKMTCGNPRVKFFYNFDKEADDLMAQISIKLKEENPNLTVIVYTGDNDLLQLKPLGMIISRKVNNGKFIPLDEDYVIGKYGVPSKDLLRYRVLSGDQSDNIPNPLPRFPKKYKDILINEWKRTKSLTESVKHPDLLKYRERLEQAIPQIKSNIKMMNLCKYKKPENQFEPEELIPTPDLSLYERFEVKGMKDYFQPND